MGAVYRFNMGPKGMVGAGALGCMCGLTTGVIVWVAQKLSGETVADRWRKEFFLIEERKRVQEEAVAKKDVRGQEIQQEERERVSTAKVVVPEENTPYTLDSEDRIRLLTIKVTEWMESVGILRPQGHDNFRIVSETPSSESTSIDSNSDDSSR